MAVLAVTYLHFSANLIQFGQAGAPVHDRAAVRADTDEVAQRCCIWLVVSHIKGWFFWSAAPEAEHFTRLALLLIFRPPGPMESIKIAAKDVHRLLVIENRESGLEPIAHSALVNLVQAGSFIHSIAAVFFGEVGFVEAFAHCTAPREQHARVWLTRKVHGGRVITFLELPDLTRWACHIEHPPD